MGPRCARPLPPATWLDACQTGGGRKWRSKDRVRAPRALNEANTTIRVRRKPPSVTRPRSARPSIGFLKFFDGAGRPVGAFQPLISRRLVEGLLPLRELGRAGGTCDRTRGAPLSSSLEGSLQRGGGRLRDGHAWREDTAGRRWRRRGCRGACRREEARSRRPRPLSGTSSWHLRGGIRIPQCDES